MKISRKKTIRFRAPTNPVYLPFSDEFHTFFSNEELIKLETMTRQPMKLLTATQALVRCKGGKLRLIGYVRNSDGTIFRKQAKKFPPNQVLKRLA